MKVIVAGSRSINDYTTVKRILDSIDWDITEIVSGGANGVDKLGEWYASEYEISLKVFEAKWNDLNAPGAIIKTHPNGVKYNANAGFDRNKAMAKYANALVLIWDGKSPGSRHMLETALKQGIKVESVVI
jgi:predicted Rossmann fold nucleotide-binding protein DprA/Smf involved in DNA uptake